MKLRFSLISLICAASVAALAFALFNANRRAEQAELLVEAINTENLSLRTRLGEQAEDRPRQFSICYFNDTYSSGDVLRWRVKAPEGSAYQLMYSKDVTTGGGSPENGRQLMGENAAEFVLAVEFTGSKLQMRTYRELSDGSLVGPIRATTINGDGWMEALASPKRFIVGLDSQPQEAYFNLGETFKILELPGNRGSTLSVWVEQRGITKR